MVTTKTTTNKIRNKMKKLLLTLSLVGAVASSFAQGTTTFGNSSTTLISAGGTSTANSVGLYYYAIFLAPSTTEGGTARGVAPSLTEPLFQTVGGYNTNSATLGRMATRTGLDVGTSSGLLGAGSTVDFIVRGWSANAGTTWAQALASWNAGAPASVIGTPVGAPGAGIYIGSSVIGNNLVLGGGAIPNTVAFGAGQNQLAGFNMAFVPAVVVPEPTSMALAGIGAASLLIFRRRK